MSINFSFCLGRKKLLILAITALSTLPHQKASAAPCLYDQNNFFGNAGYTNNNNKIWSIAHRGLWGPYTGKTVLQCGDHTVRNLPENSAQAIMEAFADGLPAVEIDVKMSRDNIPVLMHDYTLGRTTNIYAGDNLPKFDPFTGKGDDPQVAVRNFNGDISRMRLLQPNRASVSYISVPSVENVFAQYGAYTAANHNGGFPGGQIWLDIKDAAAMGAVFKLASTMTYTTQSGQKRPMTDVVFAKFSISTFPQPYQLAAALKSGCATCNQNVFKVIPFITNNNLDETNVSLAVTNWMDKSGGPLVPGFEVNLNQWQGRLQNVYNQVLRARYPVGIFSPTADYGSPQQKPDPNVHGENITFFKPDGTCCSQLGQVKFGDSQILRWDWSFLYGRTAGIGFWKRFDFITSDQAGAMANDIAQKAF